MNNLARHYNPNQTSQDQAIPGRKMVKNAAGGFTFKVNQWDQFLRFLILGTEGGSYYATEKELTVGNATNTVKCIQTDPRRAVDLIVDVSINGRAAKQNATLFALALACVYSPEKERNYAYNAITRVCRTGTMLFSFLEVIKTMKSNNGWSRGLRNGVSKFYTMKPLDRLELQVVKYRQRAGYTHRDVLRLAHPQTKDPVRNSLFKYAVGKMTQEHSNIVEHGHFFEEFKLLNAYETAKTLKPGSHKDLKILVSLITDAGLPREGVPTTFLSKPEVWDALLQRMPIGGLIRNLGKISSLDMTKSNLSDASVKIVSLLGNEEAIRKSRVHPMNILTAMKTYKQGHGDKGRLVWRPSPRIIDALDEAFHTSFGFVEATNVRHMLALDHSASMTWEKHKIPKSPLLPREASAAMAMITARVEPNHDFVGFCNGRKHFSFSSGLGHWDCGISPLSISPKQRLDDVINYIQRQPAGGTDCAAPMMYAAANKIPVDVFTIYTDNETWAGNIHPKQALDQYRQKMGIGAKLVVVAMTSSKNTIADPRDSGMLDVVGFDTATPNIISEFSLGNI